VCSPNCMGTCGVNAYVKDDRIVRLEPAAFPDPGYERICLKGIAMATQRVHHPDRLTHPMIRSGPRGSGQWRRVAWDEAFDYIAEKLEHISGTWGTKANAWISATGNYGFKAYTAAQRIANTLEGTHFTSLALSGDFAGPVGFLSTLGIPGCANDISEIGGARYLLNVGRNAADTAHSEMHFIFDAMEQGMKFVMIDPRFTRTAAKADEWLSPRPGTDTALALGMIHVVIRDGLFDPDYVRRHTNAPFLVRRDNKLLLRERDVVAGGADAFMVWDASTGGPRIADEAAEPLLCGVWQVHGADGSTIDCPRRHPPCAASRPSKSIGSPASTPPPRPPGSGSAPARSAITTATSPGAHSSRWPRCAAISANRTRASACWTGPWPSWG